MRNPRVGCFYSFSPPGGGCCSLLFYGVILLVLLSLCANLGG